MAMKLVKKTADYSIYQRGDNRYAVEDARKKPVNGEEKARILLAESLIKVTLPSPPAAVEEPAEAAAAEEAVVEASADAAAEGDAPAEAKAE